MEERGFPITCSLVCQRRQIIRALSFLLLLDSEALINEKIEENELLVQVSRVNGAYGTTLKRSWQVDNKKGQQNTRRPSCHQKTYFVFVRSGLSARSIQSSSLRIGGTGRI
ncbi:hypothetical protein OUZ56_015756 [Daphnia magna]|uniref:Secreted protein n=1 Tax=Daphnia magna TaxID=35525 RepID=A0ABR0ANN0_9CRUS|nr:hypothetical protein OUZ56_015756 [Daphnia magna]